MHSTDLNDFGTMLDAVCSLLSRGAYTPSPTNTALFFRSLSRFSLAEVRAAFDAHVADPQRGKFVPVPADILAQIEDLAANDGRPGVEEAWAAAVMASDETQSVVWTEEIALAYGKALPILQAGDKVGARMAFKEAYTRQVDAARAGRFPPQWTLSEGSDLELRARAIAEGVSLRRLDAARYPELPAPRAAVALLAAPEQGIPPAAREALLALRDWLTTPADESESPDASAKAETARRAREMQNEIARKFPGALQ